MAACYLVSCDANCQSVPIPKGSQDIDARICSIALKMHSLLEAPVRGFAPFKANARKLGRLSVQRASKLPSEGADNCSIGVVLGHALPCGSASRCRSVVAKAASVSAPAAHASPPQAGSTAAGEQQGGLTFKGKAPTFQEAIAKLQNYWAAQGCAIWLPHNTEVGAGTMNPATFLRVMGPEPWNVCYAEPSVRPDDSRYGDNPNRLQRHTQFQVGRAEGVRLHCPPPTTMHTDAGGRLTA